MDLVEDFAKNPLIIEHVFAAREAGKEILKGDNLKLSTLSNICLETLSTCASRSWPTLESGETEQIWSDLISKHTAASTASRAAAAHAAHRSEQEYGSRMPSSAAVSGVNSVNTKTEEEEEGGKQVDSEVELELNKFTAAEIREINKWSYHQGTLCMYPMLRLAFLKSNENTKKSDHRLDLMVESPLTPMFGLPE